MSSVAVIGGSGPSLYQVDPRRVPAHATIIRINNFFLEPEYFLGRRVDCAYFSSDPRAARFYVATLKRVMARGEYDVRRTASHLPAAARLGVPEPFDLVRPGDLGARRLLAELEREGGLRPTSGAMAMLHATDRGADRLVLAGMDFYAGAKYAYPLPPNLHRILRPNLSSTGYDERLHAREADLAVLRYLLDRGIEIRVAGPEFDESLGLEPAPLLPSEEQITRVPKPSGYVDDWVRWAGLWSIDMLVAARWLRRRFKRALPSPRVEQV